jgi:hypothetical protein
MRQVKVVTNRAPKFLKQAYKHPQADLVNHEGFIDEENYITFDGEFRVWTMSASRVPIPRGRFRYLNDAIYIALRGA